MAPEDICRHCGTLRGPAVRTCLSCGASRWKPAMPSRPVELPPHPPVEPPPPSRIVQPRVSVEGPSPAPTGERTGVDAVADVFVGGLWLVAISLLALCIYGAIAGTIQGNTMARKERFERGYETREDIQDHPEEYAQALERRKRRP